MKKIIVLHDSQSKNNHEMKNDFYQEIDTVSGVLSKIGYTVIDMVISIDTDSKMSEIISINPQIVFNIVKQTNDRIGLSHRYLTLFNDLGIPFTGARHNALLSTSNIHLTKNLLNLSHINTPKWQTLVDIKKKDCSSFHQ